MTSQRLYAVLRKAGMPKAKRYGRAASRPSDNWQPGVYVGKDGSALTVTYKVFGTGEEHRRRVLRERIIPALKTAGIHGVLSEDGLTFRVEG